MNERTSKLVEGVSLVVLVAGFVLAVAQRLSLPLAPFADPDTWGYIGPAITHQVSGTFPQISGRGFLYPSIVRVVLDATDSFSALTVIQHLAGLAGGILLFAAWRQARCLIPKGPGMRSLHAVLGTVLVLLYLLNNKEVFYEHSLRPEGLFLATACLTLFLAARTYCEDPKSARYLNRLWLLGFCHIILYRLHPIFSVALLGCTAIPLLRGFVSGASRGRIAAVAASLVAINAAIGFAGEHLYSQTDTTGRIFSKMTVFAFNADAVTAAIDEDLAGKGPLPFDRALLETCSEKLHAEFRRTEREGRTHSTLAYGPDVLIYSSTSVCSFVRQYFNEDAERIGRFFWHYALTGMIRHPFLFFSKTYRNLHLAYGSPDARLFTNVSPTIYVEKEYQGSRESLAQAAPVLRQAPAGAAYLKNLEATSYKGGYLGLWRIQNTIASLGASYAAWVALIAITALAATLKATRGLVPSPTSSYAGFLVLAASYNLFISTTVALVSSQDNNRYSEIQFSFSLFTWFAALQLLPALWFRDRKSADSSPQVSSPS